METQRWTEIQSQVATYKPQGVDPVVWLEWKPFITACFFTSMPRRTVSVGNRQRALWQLLEVLGATSGITVGEIFADGSIRALLIRYMAKCDSRSGLAHVKRDIVAMQRGMTGVPYSPSGKSAGSAAARQFAVVQEVAAVAPPRVRVMAGNVLNWLESQNLSAITPTGDVSRVRHWARRNSHGSISLSVLRAYRLVRVANLEVPAVQTLAAPAMRKARFTANDFLMSSPSHVLFPSDGRWIISFPHVANSSGERKMMKPVSMGEQRTTPKNQPRILSLKERQKGLSIAPKPLPPELEAILSAPNLQVVTQNQWSKNHAVVVEIMRRAQVRGVESFRKKLRVVAMFVTWADGNGYDLSLRCLLTEETINNWVKHGLDAVNSVTRSTYRSHLRNIAAHANPSSTAPPKPTRIRHMEIKPPYGDTEIRVMRRVARNQPDTQLRGRVLCCFALGLGAGLDSVDIKDLKISDIHDHGVNGIEIRVRGARPRTVWLLHGFEDLLREGLNPLPATGVLARPVRGSSPITGSSGVVSGLYATVKQAGRHQVHFEQGRLRATWLCALMCMPVPLAVLMDAAGLETPRSLSDLLPHAKNMGSFNAQTILRGETQ